MFQRKHTVFIAHTSEDLELADEIRESLSRIIEFTPYMAQDFKSFGHSFIDRIQTTIESSHFFIVLLTNSGIKSQWVNQELGYACAIRKKNRKLNIIPISDRSVKLKGFITKDTEDILFLDEFERDVLIANIIQHIRNIISIGLVEVALNIKLICPKCKGPKGLPLEVRCRLPSREEMVRTYNQDKLFWQYPCSNCQTLLGINILTLEQVE